MILSLTGPRRPLTVMTALMAAALLASPAVAQIVDDVREQVKTESESRSDLEGVLVVRLTSPSQVLIKERQPRRRLVCAILLASSGATSITPTTLHNLQRCGTATASKHCFL
jgi:hypothetical protein